MTDVCKNLETSEFRIMTVATFKNSNLDSVDVKDIKKANYLLYLDAHWLRNSVSSVASQDLES